MSLRVAVQMDPLESIKIAGDSSFALMLEAQERGHEVFHYDVRSLAWEDGRITSWARPVTVQRVEGDHYSAGKERQLDLADRRGAVARARKMDPDPGRVRGRAHREGPRQQNRERDAATAFPPSLMTIGALQPLLLS